MSYQVLARKLRPATFDALIGQEHVVRALVHALGSGRVHHAYLFTGTRGVGKTTIARILAKSLNCETGVTATPCGTCAACMAIAEGRFPDLIEVDAASRTGVDATRELLENAQYRPTRGRYKVYLIDEVHMLSTAAFNALLKTLEEPPEHVKFLLATTDPKKVPITVLSRCLQFQLKNLLPERISGYLAEVLTSEQIAYEPDALTLIARAASGSMRDALSLTDQAIAYGGGHVAAADVGAMLGTVSRDELGQLLDLLAAADGPALLDFCAGLAEQSADFVEILRALLVALHDVAVAQTIGGSGHRDEPYVARIAQSLAPETVQLFYQIVLLGLRDMHLAPDPRCGFEMVMLRLLAFEPAPPGGSSEPDGAGTAPGSSGPTAARAGSSPRGRAGNGIGPASVSTAATQLSAAQVESDDRASADSARALAAGAAPAAAERWHAVLPALALGGVARMIAEHSVAVRADDTQWELCLDAAHDMLLNESQVQAIERALNEHLPAPVRLRIVPGAPSGETPAARRERERREQHARAVDHLKRDRHVRVLIEEFDAELNLDSVRQVQSNR
jgi:DNA polymerase III subunit gamma/tau